MDTSSMTMGRPRKPTHLHAVDGTYNVTKHADRVNEPQPAGALVKPKWLKGRAAKLWDEYSSIGYWLTAADSHSLATWCGLAAEISAGLKNVTSSRISQYRALGSELGFLCASRSRINVGNALGKGRQSTDGQGAENKFFGRHRPG